MNELHAKKVGRVSSELYMWRDTQHYNLTVQPWKCSENDGAKRRFSNLVEVSGLEEELVRINPRLAKGIGLLRFLLQEHLNFLQNLCALDGAAALLEGMSATKTAADTPFLEYISGFDDQSLALYQQASLARIVTHQQKSLRDTERVSVIRDSIYITKEIEKNDI